MDEPLVLDEQAAMERVEQDLGLYSELYCIFCSDYEMSLSAMQTALSSGDASKLRSAAHSIKSALGNLGAMRAHSAAQAIEASASQGTVEKAASQVELLKTEVQQYLQAAKTLIAKGKRQP